MMRDWIAELSPQICSQDVSCPSKGISQAVICSQPLKVNCSHVPILSNGICMDGILAMAMQYEMCDLTYYG